FPPILCAGGAELPPGNHGEPAAMRWLLSLALFVCCLIASPGLAQSAGQAPARTAPDPLLPRFVPDFDPPAARQEAETRLQRNPEEGNRAFGAKGGCGMPGPPRGVLEVGVRLLASAGDSSPPEGASNRRFQAAGHPQAFSSVVRRTGAAATLANDCTFNLRL